MYRGIVSSLKELPKKYITQNNLGAKGIMCNFYFTSETRKRRSNKFECNKKDLPHTIVSKYEPFLDESIPEVFDVEKERSKINETFYDEFEGINLKRGITGVFEIEEVVSILKREKAEDVFVVRIPAEYRYANFMVIATGRSTRHMLTMIEFLRKVYKKKKNSTDIIPKVEGENSPDWKALDLGSIVVHILSKASRKHYDLETLWTVGKEFDRLSQKKSALESSITDYSKILEDLAPDKVATES